MEVGPGLFAYLQYDDSWGISNAGFLAGDDSLLAGLSADEAVR